MNEVCAYQGEPGAFSEQAARQLLGATVTLQPCVSFAALFDAVEKSRAHWAVVPVENTLAGAVTECQAWLERTHLKRLDEMRLRIRPALIAHAYTRLVDVRRARSHPVALQQCRRFFAEHPGVSAVAAHDTAGAVREVMQSRHRGEAAIAAACCAEIYGGRVLVDGIGDCAENYTRFLLVTLA